MITTTIGRHRPSVLLFALGIGIVLGLSIGWLLPVQRFTTDIASLHPDYKADYVLMVGHALCSERRLAGRRGTASRAR